MSQQVIHLAKLQVSFILWLKSVPMIPFHFTSFKEDHFNCQRNVPRKSNKENSKVKRLMGQTQRSQWARKLEDDTTCNATAIVCQNCVMTFSMEKGIAFLNLRSKSERHLFLPLVKMVQKSSLNQNMHMLLVTSNKSKSLDMLFVDETVGKGMKRCWKKRNAKIGEKVFVIVCE